MNFFQVTILKSILFFSVVFVFSSCDAVREDDKQKADTTAASQSKSAIDNISDIAVSGNITFTIIASDSATFGYDIYKEGKLVIHQQSIPGLPGNKGFQSKEAATAVAELVINKIINGEMPPTISTEELTNLGIGK